MLVLVIQLLSGIWLTMHYKPSAADAFASVEYIMRDVPWGYLIRYLHSTGASAFFVVVYLHMCRGLLYGSYKAPRELIWVIGMAIYGALMAEAFMGYLLPWGQMSFWGAQVIISLFSAIPGIGPSAAAFFSYGSAQRSSPRGQNFGKGEIEGVAASESANNGACGATMIPLLALGVPGDVITGVMLGAFMIQGLTPGPLLFETNIHEVYMLFIGRRASQMTLADLAHVADDNLTNISP